MQAVLSEGCYTVLCSGATAGGESDSVAPIQSPLLAVDSLLGGLVKMLVGCLVVWVVQMELAWQGR